MKIIDKIKQYQEEGIPFFSFEYFPPKTEDGVLNLYDRLDRMATCGPTWIDITWGAGGSTSKLTLEICTTAQQLCGLESMMHLTCTNMPRSSITEALNKAKEAGIENILALRGDPPRGEEWKEVEGGFAHAVDLVRHIRAEHGDTFGICVAGYPETHMDAESKEKDLQYLKEKVDAGADFIITQLFYDTKIFLQFVQDCRAAGINCPILPGMMPIQNYRGFKRMTSLCKTIVPDHINQALEPIQDDDAAVKAYGVKLCIEMCKELLAAGTPGLHFYTLNLEKSVMQILDGLGFIHNNSMSPLRALPWRTSAHSGRKEREDVRPIFWSNRPRSYMSRTSSWDEFPNGRWGDSRSPAFGELYDYHISGQSVAKPSLRNKWGEPSSERDVYEVFAKYCSGEIDRLPWNDAGMSPESRIIEDKLVALNRAGFLTINSQPRVNAALSTDPVVGWGGKRGYVYQKAYLEFFTSPENQRLLLSQLPKYPQLSYHCVNVKGESISNVNGTTAVTWGVFPGKEIIQPTVVDSRAFLIWKDEAFALWRTQWAALYEEGSTARQIVDTIHDTYYLVNIVDNDYVNGDIFNLIDEIINSKPADSN